MKLFEAERSATLAWSPCHERSGLIAVGTVAGALDDTFTATAQLEIMELDFSRQDKQLPTIGTPIGCNDRFHRLAWGNHGVESGTHPLGLIAGGLADGSVNIWNPHSILNGQAETSLVARVEKHQGAVKGLEFNINVPNLLASGAADSEIYIVDVSRPDQPSVFSPGNKTGMASPGEISCVAWNRKVQHILASTGSAGVSSVWDLKQKKPVISFSDKENKVTCSALAWNPDVATQIVVASEDDRFPVIQMWDLRNAFSPVTVLRGHSKGILGLSWCPNDASLLMSCGKDGRTVCWCPSTSEIISELPSSGDWNFDVQWSPRIPAVLSTASFDKKLCIHSLQDSGFTGDSDNAAASEAFGTSIAQPGAEKVNKVALKNPPKWLKRPASVSFGFGGLLVTCLNNARPDGKTNPSVKISTVVTSPDIVQRSNEFEQKIEACNDPQDYVALCDTKTSQDSVTDESKAAWNLMKILFKSDARHELLDYLGYSVDSFKGDVEKYLGGPGATSAEASGEAGAPPTEPAQAWGAEGEATNAQDGQASAEPSEVNELFKGDAGAGDEFAKLSVQEDSGVSPLSQADEGGEEASLIRKGIIVGNLQSAVDCALNAGRYADALLLAAAGGQELLAKAHEAYIKAKGMPFMKVLSAIANNKLENLVKTADVNTWKETLALVSTYAQSSDFAGHCLTIGERLEKQGDTKGATVCYMCAGNVEKTVNMWTHDASGSMDAESLQDLIEKVSVFTKSFDYKEISEGVAQLYCKWGELLASQGCLSAALHYIQKAPRGTGDESDSLAVLADRLSRSMGNYQSAVPFPFQTSRVNPAPAGNVAPAAPAPAAAAAPAAAGYQAYNQQAQPAYGQAPQQAYGQQPAQAAYGQQQAGYAGGFAQPAAAQPAAQPAFQTYNQPAATQPAPAQPAAQPAYQTYGQPAAAAPAAAPITSSGFAPPAAQPVATPTQAAPAPAAQTNGHAGSGPSSQGSAPAVMPAEFKGLQDSMNKHVGNLQANAKPQLKRKVDDIVKRLGTFSNRLAKRELSPNATQKMTELCQKLDMNDFKGALDIQVSLTTTDWDDNGQWLVGVKWLIEELKKVSGQ